MKLQPKLASAAIAITMALVGSSVDANAALIQFENFAPPGGLVNVNPGAPYTEAGFTFTPTNALSAVFDPGAASQLPGDATSWFGFAGGNVITITGTSPFNLISLDSGPSTIGTGVIDTTIIGDVFGGGTDTVTFTNVSNYGSATLNWTNLVDVRISTTSDAGIDNVLLSTTTPVPEPETYAMLLAGLGLLGFTARGRRVKAA
jgi:hypothetical protein